MARSAVRQVRVSGPLAGFRDGFKAELAGRGYTPLSTVNQIYLMAHVSRWLGERGLDAGDLSVERVDAFLVDRRGAGYTCWLSRRGLAPLLEYLRGLGVAPMPPRQLPTGPVEQLLERYRVYLTHERGLVASTVRYYVDDARLFLALRVGAEGLDLRGLTAGDVSGFVVSQCAQRSVGSAKLLVTALRSLLRFLLLSGLVVRDLTAAVPAVAGWRGSQLPKAIAPEQVEAMLRCCDRRRVTGRRDYAILLLLARLGLRATEVAACEVGDFDWRRGELVVRGKGRRDERVPLPSDVGQAVVDYLCRGRVHSASSRVFLGARAPYQAMSAEAVKHVVRYAAARAGLDASQVSAHRLRHTTATELLRAGGSLVEVGQVLRHRAASTTAIYAKVDQQVLASVAVAWPAGGAA